MQEQGSPVPCSPWLECDAVAGQGAVGTARGGEELINTIPAQSLQSQTIPCSASRGTLSGLV